MTDSATRTLISIMIVIGIIIVILFFTGGFRTRATTFGYMPGLYASAVPLTVYPVAFIGYPVVPVAPVSFAHVSSWSNHHDTDSSNARSQTTTTITSYNVAQDTTPVVTYPDTSYSYNTGTNYGYNNYNSTQQYYPTTNYSNGYNGYQNTYNNSCPQDTMTCPNGNVVYRDGPYCAFRLCQ